MSQRFEFTELRLAGLHIIDPKPIEDSRGNLTRFFCANEFEQLGFKRPIAQMNTTLTKQKGVVRGMHFQCAPHQEQKIVSCVSGAICDVVVDMREASPTYLQWHSEILSQDNKRSILIPEGFAHGFQTITKNCSLLYLHSEFYAPEAERGLRYNDPQLAIEWPEKVTFVSDRDKSHPFIEKK
jgi:dTDP-4-dehydrorhamnose 3,5-epimerase